MYILLLVPGSKAATRTNVQLNHDLSNSNKSFSGITRSLKSLGEVQAHKTSVTTTIYFEVPMPKPEGERSCIRVLEVSILPLILQFLFRFWNLFSYLANVIFVLIKPLYIYVSRIGPISGHMTLTIATFPSTTPNIHRTR